MKGKPNTTLGKDFCMIVQMAQITERPSDPLTETRQTTQVVVTEDKVLEFTKVTGKNILSSKQPSHVP